MQFTLRDVLLVAAFASCLCAAGAQELHQAKEEGLEAMTMVLVLSLPSVMLAALMHMNRVSAVGTKHPVEPAIPKESLEERFPCEPKRERSGTDEVCVICLCCVDLGDSCRTLQCGHTFHADCIMEWWTHSPRSSVTCPTCRRRQSIESEVADDQAPVQSPSSRVAEEDPVPSTAGSVPEEEALEATDEEAPAPAPVPSSRFAEEESVHATAGGVPSESAQAHPMDRIV